MARSSNRDIKYRCGNCGQEKPRDQLTVKRVAFFLMGVRGKLLRSRTVAWLCVDCRDQDPAWNAEALKASPGFADLKDDV